MANPEIFNAKIVDTFLGIEDHGLLTFYLFCEFDNSRCAFGGCSFGAMREYVNYPFTSELLMRVINTVGVSSWEELKGQLIRVRTKGLTGCSDGIDAIGNILTDDWFCIKDFYKEKEGCKNER